MRDRCCWRSVPRLRDGLLPTEFPEDGSEPVYAGADVALWFVNAVYQYLAYTGDAPTVRRHLLDSVVRDHRQLPARDGPGHPRRRRRPAGQRRRGAGRDLDGRQIRRLGRHAAAGEGGRGERPLVQRALRRRRTGAAVRRARPGGPLGRIRGPRPLGPRGVQPPVLERGGRLLLRRGRRRRRGRGRVDPAEPVARDQPAVRGALARPARAGGRAGAAGTADARRRATLAPSDPQYQRPLRGRRARPRPGLPQRPGVPVAARADGDGGRPHVRPRPGGARTGPRDAPPDARPPPRRRPRAAARTLRRRRPPRPRRRNDRPARGRRDPPLLRRGPPRPQPRPPPAPARRAKPRRSRRPSPSRRTSCTRREGGTSAIRSPRAQRRQGRQKNPFAEFALRTLWRLGAARAMVGCSGPARDALHTFHLFSRD